MSVFDDVTLEWGGKQYTIASDHMLGAIARIEEVVTLAELSDKAMRGTVPMAKLSQAYGAVLRYAGANVSDDEVYGGMFADRNAFETVQLAVNTLMAMMIPPASMRADAADQKKTKAGANGSSRNSTGRSSGKAGSGRRSSGGSARRKSGG